VSFLAKPLSVLQMVLQSRNLPFAFYQSPSLFTGASFSSFAICAA
jgi:hypothetical protein